MADADTDTLKAELIKNAVRPQMVGRDVHYDYPGKARSHVMKIGLFGDNYYVIYNSRYMDFWGPLLHLTFFSNLPEILFPDTEIGECRRFMGAEVQSTEKNILIGQYCYAEPGTFFAIKVFHVESDYSCKHLNTIFIDGQLVFSNNLSGNFHSPDADCKDFIVYWGDMTNNDHFAVSESKQSRKPHHSLAYVTSAVQLEREDIPVDFYDLEGVFFTSHNIVYWAECRPIDPVVHPTLIFVRVVKFDRAEETLSCSFLKVVDVGFPLSRNEDMDLTYILDIKHTVAGETYFLVQGTFYQQVDALKRKKYSAHFMLSASIATEE
eukprot:gene32841-37086_t